MTKHHSADIIIIGGGAAGLMAAAGAAETCAAKGIKAKVYVLEKMPRPGRKIMITGKGRCNFTNMKAWNEFSGHIHPKPNFLKPSFYNLTSEKMVDVQNIFHALEPRKLKAAYRFYCGLELENAHAAEADTLATYEVLKGQLDRYPDTLKNDVNFLSNFSERHKTVDYAGRLIYNDKKEAVISFGKHKGRTAREVYLSEPSYFAWIDNGDFTLDTKRQFALLKAQFEAEKKAAAQSRKTVTTAPRTKGYTPFESLGDLFAQEND